MDEDDYVAPLAAKFQWTVPTTAPARPAARPPAYQVPTARNLEALKGRGGRNHKNNGVAEDDADSDQSSDQILGVPMNDAIAATAAANAANAGGGAGDKPKVRRQIPKLDEDRLLRKDIGIHALHETRRKLKFKGKGHEVADFKLLMRMYEEWAHKCFGKFKLRDFAQRTERVGESKRMRMHLERWRTDPTNIVMLSDELIQADEDDGTNANAAAAAAPPPPTGDAAVGQVVANNNNNNGADNDDIFDQLDRMPAVLPPPPPPLPQRPALSAEQEEAIEAKRQAALAKIAERKRLREEQASSSFASVPSSFAEVSSSAMSEIDVVGTATLPILEQGSLVESQTSESMQW